MPVAELNSRWSHPRGRRQIRLAFGESVAGITLHELTGGRLRIVVEHRGLASVDEVEQWKFYWSDWIDAVDDGHQ
ncbi:MAG: hypothetical protein JNL54_07660 [Kineosporiaceae bacterium]|nr:hypothetical protein [Kineosporiaceae bacterium]